MWGGGGAGQDKEGSFGCWLAETTGQASFPLSQRPGSDGNLGMVGEKSLPSQLSVRP